MFSCCNILTFPAAKVLLFLHINKYLQHFNVSGCKGTAFFAYKQIFLEKITQ